MSAFCSDFFTKNTTTSNLSYHMIQSDNYFILWNNNATAKVLKKHFSPEHVICSAAELKTAKLDSAKVIIVLCELNWDEKGIEREPSIFCGVDLVKHHLRVSKKLKAPILFVSFMPESFFESAKYMILNAVGHRFMQLEPLRCESWGEALSIEDLNPLNEIQFSDIVTNLCDLRGQIGEILHNAVSKIQVLDSDKLDTNKNFEQGSQILDEHLNDICHLLEYRPDVLSLKNEVIRIFNEKVQQCGLKVAVEQVIPKYREQFQALAHDAEESTTPIFLERGWQVLLLDDNPDGIRTVINMLEKYGVVVDEYKDVIDALKAIEENEKAVKEGKKMLPITVVISDYRLYVPGTKHHQTMQGYDFLLKTSDPSKHDLRALVALSGLSRSFLLESFRKYNCRVEVYAKEDILISDKATQVFTEDIIQLGEQNYQALLSRPKVGKWDGVLKPFYVAYRQSADYDEVERQIRMEAKGYALYVEHILKDKSDKTRLQMPGLEPFKGLTTKLVDKNNKPILNHMPIFKKIMIARRIAIWLLFFEGFDMRSAYTALIHGILDASYLEMGTPTPSPEEKKKIKSTVTNLVNTTLCLSVKDFPINLLVEEIGWLKCDMGVDIDDMRAMLLQVHEHFNEGFKRSPNLIEFICKQLTNPVNDESQEKHHELKQNFHEGHGDRHFTMVSIGDLKRVVRYMGKEIRDPDMLKEAIDVLENILAYVNKDYNGAFVMKDVARYVSENIEMLRKRNLRH